MQLRKATITSKGQITIPKDIRDYLKIGPGDQIDFVISDKGEIYISPRIYDVRCLKAIFHKKGRKPATLEDMKRQFIKELKEKYHDWLGY